MSNGRQYRNELDAALSEGLAKLNPLNGYRLAWIEDDATIGLRGHEGIEQAYKKLFGCSYYDSEKKSVGDCGDTYYYHMFNGCIVRQRYDGYSIWVKQ